MIITLFGKPGAGKSTVLAAFVQQNKKKKLKYEKRTSKSKLYKWVQEHPNNKLAKWLDSKLYTKNFYDVIYCTDETIQDTIPIDYENLGRWKPQWNSCLILEEAGIGLNSRAYKALTKESKRLAAMHRHCGCDLLLASQTVDIDKAYRQRSQILFMVEKSYILPELTTLRRVIYSVDVDEQTHDLVDAYSKIKGIPYLIELIMSLSKRLRLAKFPFVRSRLIWRKKWYKYFDSFNDEFNYPMEDPYITYMNKKYEGVDPELKKQAMTANKLFDDVQKVSRSEIRKENKDDK